ncbi:uncharacterized protein [Drosophila tropicalis]|uniref:uncharacterized protein n=1 Tax=Drosophila tropicalis TaxID=46794 RepID=UPI0035AC0032
MMMMVVKYYAIVVIIAAVLFAFGNNNVVDARRNQGSSQRKSPSSSSSSGSGHVTQPSYSTNGGSNSHADGAKLSYPNYNSQPNRPIGWNPPAQSSGTHNQGPPPAYSAANPAGGARTNANEHPPPYNPPSYGAATGANVHQPITATQNHGTQYSGLPAGATYYPAAPGGYHGAPAGLPAGATYYPSGGYHPGAAAAPPPGATYYQSPAALPPGATYYAQPPQQSSGPGFGTGLLGGVVGGAVLGHLLTPSGGSSSQAAAAPPAANGGGQDRIIIINNGVPVNASADGTTVINAPGVAAPAAVATAALPMNATKDVAAPPAQLAPFNPENATMPMANGTDAVAQPPPAGGIICVPTKMNETDPNDSTKMIEVEKIACYPAPPPPAAPAGEGPAPLAPMVPQVQPGLQQVQQPPDQAAVKANINSGVGAVGANGVLMMGIALLCGSQILKL